MRHNTTFLFLLLLIVISSCATEAPSPDSDRLVVRLEREPEKLGEIFAISAFDRNVNEFLFASLGDYDPVSLEMVPVLAKDIPTTEIVESGEFAGKESYTVEILPDAVWPNGEPMTGYDYEFTLKVIWLQNVETIWVRAFSGIVDIDVNPDNPRQFTIIAEPGYFLTKESILTAEVYPRYKYDQQGLLAGYSLDELKDENKATELMKIPEVAGIGDLLSSPENTKTAALVGSGPYQLKAWETGQFIILEKKENWWGDNYPDRKHLQGYPKQIIFQILPDATIALTQMKAGEIDFVSLSRAPYNLFDDLKKDESVASAYNFYTPSIFRVYYLMMNNESPLLNDAKVREALAHALNTDQMVEQIEGGYGKKTSTVIHTSKEESAKNLPEIQFDLSKTKLLLSEAGWKDTNGDGTIDKVVDGVKREMVLRYFISGSPLSQTIATMLKEALAPAGAEVKIITKSTRLTRAENWIPGDYELGGLATTQDAARYDPYSIFHSEAIGANGQNYSQLNNPKIDELCETIRKTDDEAARNQAYQDFQELMFSEMIVVPLYSPQERYVVSKKFIPVISPKRPGYYVNLFRPAS